MKLKQISLILGCVVTVIPALVLVAGMTQDKWRDTSPDIYIGFMITGAILFGSGVIASNIQLRD